MFIPFCFIIALLFAILSWAATRRKKSRAAIVEPVEIPEKEAVKPRELTPEEKQVKCVFNQIWSDLENPDLWAVNRTHIHQNKIDKWTFDDQYTVVIEYIWDSRNCEVRHTNMSIEGIQGIYNRNYFSPEQKDVLLTKFVTIELEREKARQLEVKKQQDAANQVLISTLFPKCALEDKQNNS